MARFWSLFDLIPSLTLGAVLLFGSLAVTEDAMTLGDLVAFVSLMLMLVWPVDSLGWILANGQEAMTAADRIYEVFDTEPTIVDRAGAVAVDPDRAARCGSRASASATPAARRRCCTTSTSTSGRARRWRWSGSPAAARAR